MSARFKDVNWTFSPTPSGNIPSWEQAGVAVLMDLRDELKALNRLLGCMRFIGIPSTLDRIARNTAKKRTASKRVPRVRKQ